MNTNQKTLLCILASGVALAAFPAAAADTTGWSAFGGFTTIQPNVKSGTLSAPSLPGTQVDVGNASALTGGVSYDLNTNIRFTLAILATPFKHDVTGAGSIAGVGKIGTVKQLPPTAFAQYRFGSADSLFRPYVGVGLTYAYLFGAQGSGTLTAITNPGGTPTKLAVKSNFGLTPQLGATYDINAKWFVDANVFKTFVKTTNTLSTGQSINVKLDPLGFNLWVGYRF